MSIAICHHCPATIDTDEHEYSVTGDNRLICEDCRAVQICEDDFHLNDACICGQHEVHKPSKFNTFLELR